jgi:hypothetical protein
MTGTRVIRTGAEAGTRIIRTGDTTAFERFSPITLTALTALTALFYAVTTKTADYTATGSDSTILVNAAGGGVTVTLPAASGSAGVLFKIKKIDATSLPVTIDGSGTETIDNGTTAVITTPYVALTVQCDGTKWWII